MKTVTEVSRLTGVSVRTLHHYHAIGLLPPAQVTDAGYRLYGEEQIQRLGLIVLLRELGFSLRDVRRLLDMPDSERNRLLEQQIARLQQQRDHLDNLITLARGIHMTGVKNMDFSTFDARKADDYAAQAKALWGKSDAYREFEERDRSTADGQRESEEAWLMQQMARFGEAKRLAPSSAEAQGLVHELRAFITGHFYTCTPQILRGLARWYSGGGAITEAIDKAGGAGTAAFAARAMEIYCDHTQE